MHLQIRNKEKYLLISMIWYLIIVSSALFLIFSPVQAYTEINSYTVTKNPSYDGSGIGYSLRIENGTYFQNTITKVQHISGALKSNASAPTSLTDFPVDYRLTNCAGALQATGMYSYSGASASGYSSVTFQYTFDNWYASQSTSAKTYMICRNASPVLRVDDASLYNFQINETQTTPSPSPWAARYNSGPYYVAGDYVLYSGGSIPVINNVTSFPDCLEPGTGVVLESDVSGDVVDWTWEIYEPGNPVAVFTSLTPVEVMVDPYVLEPGYYDVQLTVENAGGTDFWQQDDFLYINQSGTCNFTPYNPFPTISTTPTQNIYATMTPPPAVLVNMTGVNEVVNNSYLGNWSLAYRQDVDRIGEGFNTTLVGVVSIVQSPLTMIVNGIAEGVSLFSVSINSLMSYTTIPLAIVGITLSYYPWQIITLITAGIAIDAAFILIFGVGR